MKKKITTKLVGLSAAFFVAFSLFPASAFADAAEPEETLAGSIESEESADEFSISEDDAAIMEEDENITQIKLEDCVKIGEDENFECDINYVNIGDAYTTVTFPDISMEDGMYSGLFNSGFGTGAVMDLSQGFGITWEKLSEEYGDSLDEAACEGLDFSNIYGLFIIDDNDDSYIFIIQGVSKETIADSGFTTDVGTVVSFTEKAVAYEDYSAYPDIKTEYMDLYTVTVPMGSLHTIAEGDTVINIAFEEDRLAYAYDANGTYIASCGAEGDGAYENNGQTGQKAAVVKALEGAKLPKYIYVQTPYDDNWHSDYLYAIEFKYSYTFTASYNGRELTDIRYIPDNYEYLDYMTGETTKVGTYMISIPDEADSIDFVTTDPVLHYNYTREGEFLGGWVTNFQEGDTSFTQVVDYGDDMTPADNVIDYIQIQSPYDDAYNSTLLYTISFVYGSGKSQEEKDPEPLPQDVASIYENVGAAQYAFLTEKPVYGNEWDAMELARAGYGAVPAYINSVLKTVKTKEGKLDTSKYDYTNYAKTVLTLTACGYDPSDVAGYDLLKPLSDFDAIMNQGVNGAIYALIALDSHAYQIPAADDGKTQTTREKLIDAILDAQLEDNGWDYSNKSADPDMTAMALQALAPYYYSESGDIRVKKAVDAALQTLSAMQTEEGTFTSPDASGAPTSESTAQVLVALTALGIDPGTDARFIKNEATAVSGLCSFWTDGGFKHIASGQINRLATVQGYYALVSYFRFMQGKTGLFDMSDVTLARPEYQGYLVSAELGVTSTPYTGSRIDIAGTVKVYGDSIDSDSVILTQGKDYTVSCENNVNAGTAVVKITGTGSYMGTMTKNFTITPASIEKAAVTAASGIYTGSAITPAPVVKLGSVTLKKDTDYTVAFNNNINAGKAEAVVTGKGNYAGTARGTFNIEPASIDKAKVTVKAATYTGKARTPAPVVKIGSVTLKKNTDYTVKYSNNKKVGTAKVTITGKGNYTGIVTGKFKINKAANTMTLSASNKTVKYSKVKKAGQTVSPITVKKAKGKVKYAKYSGTKNIIINKNTGKITVKKGTKKGKYTIKVKVTAAGNSSYKKLEKRVTFKVTVK